MKEMHIIKRSGEEKTFDITKIENAIRKASQAVDYKNALSEGRIKLIAEEVAGVCEARDRAMTVEEIQDVVETKIMEMGAHEVAKKYITYRYKQNLLRQANTTDQQIMSLIECNNEEVKQENANKNPTINSVQRDYLPQAFSDFIYAIIIEEGGFGAGALVMFLYLLLLGRAIRIAQRCKHRFPAYLVMGLALMMVTQAMMNMAVAVRAMPVTGQTLPLISKGGTSTFVSCAYIGMILSVSRSAKRREPEKESQPTTVEA